MTKFATHLRNKFRYAKIFDSRQRYLRDLRISVTDKCNFRCIYCMPTESFDDDYKFLKREDILSFEEIAKVAALVCSIGVKKIRFTGGEPLLRKNLCELIGTIRQQNPTVKLALTTNGVLLPKYASDLKKAGINRLTVSLGSLDEENFKKLNGGRGTVAEVLAGIKAAEKTGFKFLKINVTVLRGQNDLSAVNIARYFKGTGHIVRFIEFMDVGNCNNWQAVDVVSSTEIIQDIAKKMPLIKLKPNYYSEVAKRFAYEDGEGEIGFISSVSKPFCSSCSRLRLSADGKLYTCLFGFIGHDLKSRLRQGLSEQELLEWIKAVWQKRDDQYSEIRFNKKSGSFQKRIEMYQIGG